MSTWGGPLSVHVKKQGMAVCNYSSGGAEIPLDLIDLSQPTQMAEPWAQWKILSQKLEKDQERHLVFGFHLYMHMCACTSVKKIQDGIPRTDIEE